MNGIYIFEKVFKMNTFKPKFTIQHSIILNLLRKILQSNVEKKSFKLIRDAESLIIKSDLKYNSKIYQSYFPVYKCNILFSKSPANVF